MRLFLVLLVVAAVAVVLWVALSSSSGEGTCAQWQPVLVGKAAALQCVRWEAAP